MISSVKTLATLLMSEWGGCGVGGHMLAEERNFRQQEYSHNCPPCNSLTDILLGLWRNCRCLYTEGREWRQTKECMQLRDGEWILPSSGQIVRGRSKRTAMILISMISKKWQLINDSSFSTIEKSLKIAHFWTIWERKWLEDWNQSPETRGTLRVL